MPEGPSIVILREQVADFEGRTIVRAEGSSKDVAMDELAGQPILALRTFGKHFLIRLADRALRIHLLMFGTYLINQTKEAGRAKPRLSLFFDDDSALHFYTCSIKTLSDDLDSEYDWRGDVMSDAWSPALARPATAPIALCAITGAAREARDRPMAMLSRVLRRLRLLVIDALSGRVRWVVAGQRGRALAEEDGGRDGARGCPPQHDACCERGSISSCCLMAIRSAPQRSVSDRL